MRRTLVAMVQDQPGVLNRIVSLFRRRNFNIESLTVGHSEVPGVSRLTMVVEAKNVPAEQFVYQLDRLVNIIDVTDLTETDSVVRELALVKVKADSETRSEVMQLVEIFRAKIIDVGLHSLVIEASGPEDRVQSLISLLKSFGILEIVRTGRVAMTRGPGSSNHRQTGSGRVRGQPALVKSAVA